MTASDIGKPLRHNGMAVLDSVPDRDALAELARTVCTIVQHRDSGPDGVTTIADSGERVLRSGYAAFGHGELLPHTDGSGVPRPPELLLMACERPAEEGGECVLIDGQAVYDELAATAPDALRALSAPRSVLFGGASGYFGSVFSRTGDRVQVRLRLDELATYAPEAERHLPQLRAILDRHRTTLRLGKGQGYVLDNHRWLHARRQFTGQRVMHRIIGDALPDLAMKPGFARTIKNAA